MGDVRWLNGVPSRFLQVTEEGRGANTSFVVGEAPRA